ncbi:SURF1 family protein [Lysobacter niabensis]|uniref:SURF1 family protein n=1 Tax=Agrilutibacter niabensis TaxID=380628 RepID=UPI0036103266
MTRKRNLAVGWAFALLAIVLFVKLGLWQSQRAVEKQAMLDAVAQVLAQRRAVPLAQAADAARRHAYDWSAGAGRFDDRGPLWLDNQQRDGRTGVRAYRVFLPEGAAPLLVDLGWLPLPADRAMPAIALPRGRIEVRGLLVPPPSSGLALGSGIARQGEGWVLTRLDPEVVSRALALPAPLAPRVLRLDPALPLGYARDLQLLANTLPPERHRGYAVQWFALAIAVLVTALILTFRKARNEPS